MLGEVVLHPGHTLPHAAFVAGPKGASGTMAQSDIEAALSKLSDFTTVGDVLGPTARADTAPPRTTATASDTAIVIEPELRANMTTPPIGTHCDAGNEEDNLTAICSSDCGVTRLSAEATTTNA